MASAFRRHAPRPAKQLHNFHLSIKTDAELCDELEDEFRIAQREDPELSWSRFIRKLLRLGLKHGKLARASIAKATGHERS